MRPVIVCAILSAVVLFAPGCGDSSDTDAATRLQQSAAQRRAEQERNVRQTAIAEAAAAAEEKARAKAKAKADAATADAPKGSGGALFSDADVQSFQALGQTLSGEEGVAVAGTGLGQAVSTVGGFRSGSAWSTAKVPVAMAAIEAGSGSESDLSAAITASDNAAAERLWSSLGSPEDAASAATAQLRKAGDEGTEIQSQRLLGAGYTAFGQTDWSLEDQAKFVGGMACTPQGGQVLNLMGDVVAGQSWGLGTTGQGAAFKGGWGPGTTPGSSGGWLDRQMGIIRVSGKPIAVAIATTAGDHGTGTSNLTKIAQWVAEHVDADGAPSSPRC